MRAARRRMVAERGRTVEGAVRSARRGYDARVLKGLLERIGPRTVRDVFVRLLGLTAAIAFASLLPQLAGLFGPEGIAPAGEFVAALHREGARGFFAAPTLFWFASGLGALRTAAWLGVVLGLLVVLGVAPRAALLLLWALYLSFLSVGDVFLGYQWDALLLESCVVGAFYAPAGLWPRDPQPSPAGRRPLRWLLFKVMLLSGFVKLASGDPTWRHLTALEFHFWTQPLPNPISLAVAAAPKWMLDAMCAGTLVLELVVPFLVFGPRRVRRVAFAALLSLQALITLTGNYGFFNLLTAVLCVPLLEDAPAIESRARPVTSTLLSAAIVLPCLALVPSLRAPLSPVLELEGPFATFNRYGLFAVMTTRRDELSIEGSDDGRAWQPYTFRYKPELDRVLPIAAPHQPRLDWQMWFAALSSCEDNPWLLRLSERLLQGSAPARGLFASAPFTAHPPRLLRITARAFTPAGLSFHAGPADLYCPVLTLADGHLAAVRGPQ
jgi:hypothetical protein